MNNQADRPSADLPGCPSLQPLREVGTEDKSQYWDFEDIALALREARRLGIAPERLFQRATGARLARAS